MQACKQFNCEWECSLCNSVTLHFLVCKVFWESSSDGKKKKLYVALSCLCDWGAKCQTSNWVVLKVWTALLCWTRLVGAAFTTSLANPWSLGAFCRSLSSCEWKALSWRARIKPQLGDVCMDFECCLRELLPHTGLVVVPISSGNGLHLYGVCALSNHDAVQSYTHLIRYRIYASRVLRI